QRHLAVRQLDPWYPDFEIAFMLKEVEVPEPLDLGVVNLVFARSLGMAKAAARHKIDVDGQPPLPGIEVHRPHEPRRADAQGCRKQLVGHRVVPPSTGQSDQSGRSSRRVNRRSRQPVDLWTAGAQRSGEPARRPQLHRLNNNNNAVYQSILPTRILKEAL